tara:strand:+ start:1891 stop:2487 length:597 start_codon:yes stop_codon:yes gene_type:complete
MALVLNGSANTISGLAVGGLPDGIVDNDMLANNVNTVTHYDCWRLATNSTDEDEDPLGSATAIERAIDANGNKPGFGTFGDPMTHSGGIFSFPATGYWKVEFQVVMNCPDASYNNNTSINVTTDGGTTWNALSTSQGSVNDDNDQVYNTNYCSLVIDVTNVSNVKVKFSVMQQDADASILGQSEYNRTCMMFTRIGNT